MTLCPPVSDIFAQDCTVALLIDGENIAADRAETILEHAGRLGVPRIRRVYGNAALLTGWDGAPGVDLIHTHSGKNSADIKLAIDAVDLAARGLAQRFVLVSSDGDFTHLARYLRERGYCVTGMGGPQTPAPFQRACERFVVIGAWDRPEPVLEGARPNKTEQEPILKDMPLYRAVAEIMRRECGTSWVDIAKLNPMVRRHLDVRIATCPEKTWNGFLTKHGNMFQCDGQGAARRVRLRG